jgi:predicted ester cyclase
MSREANIAATKKWGSEVASNGNYDALDEILAPDFVDHDPAPDQDPGVEGLKGFFRMMRSAFPDLKAEAIELVADNDKVAMSYTLSGTQNGKFMGVDPTGKSFKVTALQLARFEDGRCVERWGSTDELGILKQLGILDDAASKAKDNGVVGALFGS